MAEVETVAVTESVTSFGSLNPEVVRLEPFLSQKLMHLLYSCCAVGAMTGVNYYSFDMKRGQFVRQPYRRGHSLGRCLGFIETVGHFSFLFYQVVAHLSTAKHKLDKTILIIFLVMVFKVMSLVFQFESKFYCDEVGRQGNAASGFLKDFGKYFPREENERKIRALRLAEYFLMWVLSNSVLMYTLSLLVCIAFPNMKVFISSLCQDPGSSWRVPLHLFSFLFLCHYMYVLLSGVLFYSMGIALTFVIQAAIKKARKLKVDDHGPETLVTIYKQMHLLIEQLNRTCSTLLFPATETILVGLTVFGVYGSLRLHGLMRFVLVGLGFFTSSILFFLFYGLAQINMHSKLILQDWRRNIRISQRHLKSLRPLKVTLSSYAYVDTGITLTIADAILSYSINLLLLT